MYERLWRKKSVQEVPKQVLEIASKKASKICSTLVKNCVKTSVDNALYLGVLEMKMAEQRMLTLDRSFVMRAS